ncbi:putative nuclease HARBI1 [Saccostrea cucullata]|uniref:putative nuclease HARBI1 n=1 Tax=Saccostrea cuccullata TaxID=36930 RepID=UPI002ED13949
MQVLVTLRYLSKGNFFSELGDLHGISRSSVSRIIHNVCMAINRTMNNISFPRDAPTLRCIKTDFFNIAHFPNCVGAVDGTLIPIKGMGGPEEAAYVCRKNYYALNVQTTVDSKMRFIHVNACFPGPLMIPM